MIDEAELILFLVDAQRSMDEEEKKLYDSIDSSKVILVHNKSDLSSQSNRLEISAMNKDIKALIDVINDRFESHQFVFKRPVLSTQRTIGLAIQALVAMNQAIESIELENEIDLINIDLREAYQALNAIGSTSTDTNINDEIFSRFCLGK